jgi:cytidylate kinase
MSRWQAAAGLTVAIDGPSGSGKGTVATMLAAEIGLPVLDTGLLYRFVGVVAHSRGIDLADEDALAALANGLVDAIDWRADGIHFEGENWTDRLRGEDAGAAASQVAASPQLRACLLDAQRRAAARGCIMDGRDVGTVVLPHAQAKFFLTASLRERARRRWAQLQGRRQQASFDQVIEDLRRRDQRDMQRTHSPLKPAEDAISIDSTTMRADEVVDRMLAVLERRGLIGTETP